MKKFSFLLCLLLLLTATTVFAQNIVQDKNLTYEFIAQTESSRRNEVSNQVINNYNKMEIDISKAVGARRTIVVDLLGDVDTIRKSYEEPMLVYKERVEYSYIDNVELYGQIQTVTTRIDTDTETLLYKGSRPITITRRLVTYRDGDKYKLSYWDINWSSSRSGDLVYETQGRAFQGVFVTFPLNSDSWRSTWPSWYDDTTGYMVRNFYFDWISGVPDTASARTWDQQLLRWGNEHQTNTPRTYLGWGTAIDF